jgi:hypothetical protein
LRACASTARSRSTWAIATSANDFTIYAGDHTSAVAFRFQDFVIPFFAKNLVFSPKR